VDKDDLEKENVAMSAVLEKNYHRGRASTRVCLLGDAMTTPEAVLFVIANLCVLGINLCILATTVKLYSECAKQDLLKRLPPREK